MGAEIYKEDDKHGYSQEFPEEEAGQEMPSAGYGQIDQILESISALASSTVLLKAQANQ